MTFDNTVAMSFVIGAFFLLFTAEVLVGEYKKKGLWTMGELGVSVLSFINFLGVRVVLLAVISFLLLTLFPNGAGFMADWPVVPLFIGYLLVEEYIHYWVHRFAHEFPLLWRFHKPHHAPEFVNLTISYRENWLWFFLIPNAWLGSIMVWGGQMEIAMIAVAIKGVSEWLVHTSIRWDAPLQKNPITRPFMWVLERVVTLPDTHHVHHGVGKYGNAMGNYGSFLFLFDTLHGTGTFPHAKQEGYGLPDGVKIEPWYEQLWWPFFKTKRAPGQIAASVASEQQVSQSSVTSITTKDGRRIIVGAA